MNEPLRTNWTEADSALEQSTVNLEAAYWQFLHSVLVSTDLHTFYALLFARTGMATGNGMAALAAFHKARVNAQHLDIPAHLVSESRDWLHAHGFADTIARPQDA